MMGATGAGADGDRAGLDRPVATHGEIWKATRGRVDLRGGARPRHEIDGLTLTVRKD